MDIEDRRWDDSHMLLCIGSICAVFVAFLIVSALFAGEACT